MKLILYFSFVLLVVLVGIHDTTGSLQTTNCEFVCQGRCWDDYTFASNETTLCHTHPCTCVLKSDSGNLFVMKKEGKTLEGDILIHPKQEELVKGVYGKTPVPRSIFHIKRFYWTKYMHKGLYYVPYVLDQSITDTTVLDNIQYAFREFRQRTCVRFVTRSSQQNYIRIKSGGGCYAHIGMNGGEQTVSLENRGCKSRGTAIHELMHSIGFFHEQSRSDRDQYIRINKRNIIKGLEGNFEKRTSAVSLGSPYDYGSVMHYSLDAFSRNKGNTIIPLRRTDANIGQRDGFSDIDVDQINKLYPCSQVSGQKRVTSSNSVVKRPVVVRPTTTYRRPTTMYTTRPTTTRNPTCKDEINNCGDWISKGYCSRNSKFYVLAKKYCLKSCRACPTPTVHKIQIPAVKENCFNKLNTATCQSWAAKGYCSHNVYSSYLAKRCRKACNRCEGNIIQKDELAPIIQKDQMSGYSAEDTLLDFLMGLDE